MVSATIGTMAASGLAGLPRGKASTILALLSLPVMLPPLVLAVALVTFFVSLGVKLSLVTVTISHVLLTQPFVILIVYAQMRDFDLRMIESARDLGASAWTAFRTVTLPIIRPTVVGSALMAAAISLRRLRHHLLHDGRRQYAADLRLGHDALLAHADGERDRHPPSRRHDSLHASRAVDDALSRLTATERATMNRNPLKTRLAAGKPVVGPYIQEFTTAGMASIVAATGADFLIYDYEHSGWTTESLRTQMLLARGAGLVPIVNVPGERYEREGLASRHRRHGADGAACARRRAVPQARGGDPLPAGGQSRRRLRHRA